jgi:hypothetical protein
MGIMPCSPLHVFGHRPDYFHRPLYDPASQALPDVGLLSDWGWWNPKITYWPQPSHSWLARIVCRSIGDCFSNFENLHKLSGQIQYLAQDFLVCWSKFSFLGPYIHYIEFSNLQLIHVTFNRLSNKYSLRRLPQVCVKIRAGLWLS